MNILITGGAGFIGSHIIEELIKIKNDKYFDNLNYNKLQYDKNIYTINNIIVLDNLSSGKVENINPFLMN